LPLPDRRRSIGHPPHRENWKRELAMKDYVLKNKPEPASNEIVWGSARVPRADSGVAPEPLVEPFGLEDKFSARRRKWRPGRPRSPRIRDCHATPAELALPRERGCCACLRRPRSRVLPRGETKTAAGSRSAAVPGCECGWRLAASSIAGRDARPTRRRDACATRFMQDYATPTALERIELKIPIKFSTRFGNGRRP
jgi:hypothetical protein